MKKIPITYIIVSMYALFIYLIIFGINNISFGFAIDFLIAMILSLNLILVPSYLIYKEIKDSERKEIIKNVGLTLGSSVVFVLIFIFMTFNFAPSVHVENRHLVLVHGSVLISSEREERIGLTHFDLIKDQLLDAFDIYEQNYHIPDWIGENNRNVRSLGGEIVASYIRMIFSDNPNAEILLIGYSHGGNVAKIALNSLGDEFDFSRITLVGTGTPAFYYYQLHPIIQENLNHHFNFYNTSDAVQNIFALIGGSGDLVNLDEHEIGRAQYGATNVQVETGVITGWANNWLRNEAHSSMRTSSEIWEYYKIPRIRAALEGIVFGEYCSGICP